MGVHLEIILINKERDMSYTLVKSIRFDKKNGKVWVEMAESNIFPRTYDKSEWKWASELLKKGELEKLEKDILLAYWSGDFQGSDKYSKAIKLFCDYDIYNWNLNYKDNQEVKEDLLNHLYTCYKRYLEESKDTKKVVIEYDGDFIVKCTTKHIITKRFKET
jgi:hypothetical protein